jgi:diaminohydroxyphosphoribosylaminopyrimidine deaminase / 5-amino-6-(5-phosphoribosylamino)uracil reductase
MPPAPHADESFMQQALLLAIRGVGIASPNPTVGCVIVKDGVVIGEGFHDYDLRDHAEIVALRQAGTAAKGATAYVTLEPCSHHGRTPPCANALIAAGVARVVVATEDPNPKVAGSGLAMLRAAGIDVVVGPLAAEARALNDAFAKFVTTGVPFVTLKLALSLDARIAPPPGTLPAGTRLQLTGYAACEHVQQLRHASDAIVTGIGTILADDPLLTDRSGLRRQRPLLRVILDSQLRLPLSSRVVESAARDLVVACCGPIPARAGELERAGVRVVSTPPGADGRVSLPEVVRALAEEQVTSVLLEPGAALAHSALAATVPCSIHGALPLVDKLALFYAPIVLGDSGLRFTAPALGPMQQMSAERMGDDILFTGYLRNPWPNPNSRPDIKSVAD